MAKTITVNFEGNEYTLEFTRKTIELMEKQGFDISAISSKPMTMIPSLFKGAFLAHHRFVKDEVVDKILGQMKDKMALLEKLAEMYNEPMETLLADNDSEGNAEWGASW